MSAAVLLFNLSGDDILSAAAKIATTLGLVALGFALGYTVTKGFTAVECECEPLWGQVQ